MPDAPPSIFTPATAGGEPDSPAAVFTPPGGGIPEILYAPARIMTGSTPHDVPPLLRAEDEHGKPAWYAEDDSFFLKWNETFWSFGNSVASVEFYNNEDTDLPLGLVFATLTGSTPASFMLSATAPPTGIFTPSGREPTGNLLITGNMVYTQGGSIPTPIRLLAAGTQNGKPKWTLTGNNADTNNSLHWQPGMPFDQWSLSLKKGDVTGYIASSTADTPSPHGQTFTAAQGSGVPVIDLEMAAPPPAIFNPS